MKTARTATLFAAFGILSLILYSQAAALREQRRQLQELNAKLESKSKTTSLELQAECAKQAHEAFKLNGWEGNQWASFTNHYNEKLNKCFVEIENTDTKTSPGKIGVTNTVSDAFEGKVYGQYIWISEKNKQYFEVPPFQCEVTLTSGEKKICRSSDEFDALIRNNYME
jgi:hypothetical protein